MTATLRHAHTPGRLPVVLTGLLAAGLLVHRLGRRSGASGEEVSASLPGDAQVPEPMWESTRAITIAAPPPAVWPWIVQMGYPAFRAGWYTPHWLDRLQWGIREHSAERIVEELQTLAIGDRVPDSPDWSVFFTVAELEPERALVLRSTRHLLRPMRSIEFSWAFVLQPLSADRTRFLVRARARYAPRWSWLVLGPPYLLGDFLNTSNILHAVKRRAERAAAPRAGLSVNGRQTGGRARLAPQWNAGLEIASGQRDADQRTALSSRSTREQGSSREATLHGGVA